MWLLSTAYCPTLQPLFSVTEVQRHLFHLCCCLLQLDYSLAGYLVNVLVTCLVHQHKMAGDKTLSVTDRHDSVQQHELSEDKLILSVINRHYHVQHRDLAEDTTIFYVTN